MFPHRTLIFKRFITIFVTTNLQYTFSRHNLPKKTLLILDTSRTLRCSVTFYNANTRRMLIQVLRLLLFWQKEQLVEKTAVYLNHNYTRRHLRAANNLKSPALLLQSFCLEPRKLVYFYCFSKFYREFHKSLEGIVFDTYHWQS